MAIGNQIARFQETRQMSLTQLGEAPVLQLMRDAVLALGAYRLV